MLPGPSFSYGRLRLTVDSPRANIEFFKWLGDAGFCGGKGTEVRPDMVRLAPESSSGGWAMLLNFMDYLIMLVVVVGLAILDCLVLAIDVLLMLKALECRPVTALLILGRSYDL